MIVGVVGGGQLGRMLGLAGVPLGLRFRFLDPSPEAPARAVGELIQAPYDDREALRKLAEGATVVTYEFENVPADAAEYLSSIVSVHPKPAALAVSQDRLNEKNLFRELGIPVAPFAQIDSLDDLNNSAGKSIKLPAVLKTRRLGYDGKGQAIVRSREELAQAWEAIGRQPAILEEFVQFECELSMLAVSGSNGSRKFYPLIQNTHLDGILHLSEAPARCLLPSLQAEAERYATKLLNKLDYCGLLTIEFFMQNGTLMANEMAPRVHNSGHWTIEGSETSQFENHLRGILGLPLGSTAMRSRAAMLNLVGGLPNRNAAMQITGAHPHYYDKEPRARRKVGHVTLLDGGHGAFDARLEKLLAIGNSVNRR